MNVIKKLLSICKPFKPDGVNALSPEFICATDAELAENSIRLNEIPKDAYDGHDTETTLEGDDIIHTRRVNIFRRSHLER